MSSYNSVLFLSLVIAVQFTVHVQCACEKKCTGQNEEYTNCTETACRPITCNDVGNSNLTNCQDNPSKCTPACICKDGYARNKNGSCIQVKNCPSCGGDPNAVSGCGNHCEDNCSNLGKKPGSFACAQYCIINSCDCRQGYYYNDDTKKCVKPSQCPAKKCTGQNEEYTNCTESACRPITCNDVGNSNLTNCQDNPSKCTPACICKDGYARNKNGSCIQVKNCPSCGGDPNAVSGCGNHCEDNCSNLGKKPGSYACAAYCIINSCDCRQGYYYNDDTKKCVKPSQCPATSCNGDPNAVPGCGNHCQDNCSNYGVDPSTYGCAAYCVEGGCDCKKGFYYNNKTKLCGTPSQCPKC